MFMKSSISFSIARVGYLIMPDSKLSQTTECGSFNKRLFRYISNSSRIILISMDIYTPENVALQATNSTSFQGIIIS